MALQEHFGTTDLRGKKYVLTWTYHPKPLNTAVANSALTIATRMGMDVTLLCPTPDYVLDERYMGWAARNVAESGGSLQVSHDIESAYAGADVVYAKSWGALPYFGRWEQEKPIRDQYQALHRRRSQDGADQQRRVLALPAAAPQHQGHRRGDGLAQLHRHRGSREPPARAEGDHGGVGQPMIPSEIRAGFSPPSTLTTHRRETPSTENPMTTKDIVLAFSGGLDTSFCVPYLQERGWAVHTVFADTGGVDAEERAFIEQRAAELGVASHVTVDGGPAIWDGFVKPFVWAGEGYQGQYPLLVSDRYLIVDAALARAQTNSAPASSRTAAPAWATTRCASTWR